ncbi:hypothetical protein A4X13_0g2294 [Tilletia indica]|uniref:DNA 3'-5' helicase n=1 Tax=Tilletia indica TaxID=43049 RepID=A0A177TWH9_9BASI|nr:hypothetical protein A4X13_0g2294 [Tilletia indica]
MPSSKCRKSRLILNQPHRALPCLDQFNKYNVKQRLESLPRQNDVLSLIRSGSIKVVFACPEAVFSNRAVSSVLCDGIWGEELSGIVVDEAHVVYDWGITSRGSRSAFRPEYGKLALLRAKFGSQVPVLAVSATLSGPCLPAICSSLGFGRLPFFALDVGRQRDGSSYDIQKIQHPVDTYLDIAELLPGNCSSIEEIPKTLIYVNTKREALDVADAIRTTLPNNLGSAIKSLTASDSPYEKAQVLSGLRSSQVRVVAATEALGMGIDLPDIDMVIQWKLPRDFKTLVQHFGRGARGENAHSRAILLCESWAMQVRDFKMKPSTALVPANLPSKLFRERWDKLDDELKMWLTAAECIKKATASLLALNFADIATATENHSQQIPTSIIINNGPIGLGPISSNNSDRRFFWRRLHTDSIPQPPSTSSFCCITCDPEEPPARCRSLQAPPGAWLRLQAPPIHVQTNHIRQELGTMLFKWRAKAYQALVTTDQHNWLPESALIGEDVILALSSQAPRILAHKAGGAAIDAEYVRSLVAQQSGLTTLETPYSMSFDGLSQQIDDWAVKNLDLALISELTATGRIKKRKVISLPTTTIPADLAASSSSMPPLSTTQVDLSTERHQTSSS